MKRVTLTAFMVCAAWLSFGQTARLGDLNRNSVVVTSAPPQSVVSVNGQTGEVVVTAVQIGALTNELDLAALRAYHYGSPDIVESPAEWFVFDGAGTVMAFNYAAGRENVVIPWAIGGVPVTAIGGYAFDISGVVSLITPQTVTSIGDSAFASCTSLTSVSLPQVQTVGYDAFSGCTSLTSLSLPQAQTVGEVAFYYCTSLTAVHTGQNAPAEATDVFSGITPPPTVYVTDPQATGWGAVWNGAPVVRPPLYGSNVTAQAFTLGGDTITEWPSGGGELDPVANAALVVHTNRADNPHGVTAAQIGAITSEQGLAALRTLVDGHVTDGAHTNLLLNVFRFPDNTSVSNGFLNGTNFISFADPTGLTNAWLILPW